MAGLIASMLAGGLRGGGAAYENVSRTAYEDELRQQREKIANDRAVALERMRQDRADSRDAINREDAWNRTSAGLIYRQADLDRQASEAEKDRTFREGLTDKQIASSEKIAGMPAKRAEPLEQIITDAQGNAYTWKPGQGEPKPMTLGGEPFMKGREGRMTEADKARVKSLQDQAKAALDIGDTKRADQLYSQIDRMLGGSQEPAGGGLPKPTAAQIEELRAANSPSAIRSFAKVFGQEAADAALGTQSKGLVTGEQGKAAAGDAPASPSKRGGLVNEAAQDKPASSGFFPEGKRVQGAGPGPEKPAAEPEAKPMSSLERNDLERGYVDAIRQIKGQIDGQRKAMENTRLTAEQRQEIAMRMQKMMNQIQVLKGEAAKQGLKLDSAGSVL